MKKVTLLIPAVILILLFSPLHAEDKFNWPMFVPATIYNPPKYLYVFVTSSTHSANFGGLSGADTICQNLANSAGLPGTYLAWLSDSTGSPSTKFNTSTVPYVNTRGQIVANDWNDLIDGTLVNAISYDENGNSSVVADTFTNTLSDGTNNTLTNACANWTSNSEFANVGSPIATNENWTNMGTRGHNLGYFYCGLISHLYCFQQ